MFHLREEGYRNWLYRLTKLVCSCPEQGYPEMESSQHCYHTAGCTQQAELVVAVKPLEWVWREPFSSKNNSCDLKNEHRRL